MTPDVAISIATFVVVLWLLSRLTRTRSTPIEVDPDAERARQFVRIKVEEHAETLAERYREACEEDRRGDRVPGRLAREIERLIGNVLLHDGGPEKPEIGPALRAPDKTHRTHSSA